MRCYRASGFQREGGLGSNPSSYSPLLMARVEWPTVYSRQRELDSCTDTQAVSDQGNYTDARGLEPKAV